MKKKWESTSTDEKIKFEFSYTYRKDYKNHIPIELYMEIMRTFESNLN